MKTFWKTIVFICCLCVSPALASELVITQNDLGTQVEVSISISDSPKIVSFGFDLLYDYNALEYAASQEEDDERGDLTENFGFFNTNEIDIGLIRIGAFFGEIESGQNGSMAVLKFNKKVNLENYQITLINLVDNIKQITPPTPPVIPSNQSFQVNESAAVGYIIGKLLVIDEKEENLNFAITVGNTENAFRIEYDENNNDEIREAQIILQGTLNYQTKSQYELTIEVSDGTDRTSSVIRINLFTAGDIFQDQKVDLLDALLALKVLAGDGIDEQNLSLQGTINKEKIEMADAIYILRFISELNQR